MSTVWGRASCPELPGVGWSQVALSPTPVPPTSRFLQLLLPSLFHKASFSCSLFFDPLHFCQEQFIESRWELNCPREQKC